ncbi:MAG: arginine--tRNA ligase [Coriobacteriia bacterium]|nr:arginine--tRNA ligase [Coriobacteriia bacterium]
MSDEHGSSARYAGCHRESTHLRRCASCRPVPRRGGALPACSRFGYPCWSNRTTAEKDLAAVKAAISTLVASAVQAAIAAGELPLAEAPEPALERPRDVANGDWATTVAMRCAKQAGMNPRQIAEIVVGHMAGHPDIDALEIAGPGFINIRLSPHALQRVLVEARTQATDFGRSDAGAGRKVQVEFVSANPVGPMHVGHGRWAALGDSMARVLEHAGWKAEREFYINDAGVQMDIFAKSVSARYLELCGDTVVFEDDWYQGAYIMEIAREIFEAEGPKWRESAPEQREAHFKEQAYVAVLEHLKHVLHGMGVDFDVWFSERTLHETGAGGDTAIVRAIGALRTAGYIYDHEGAVWFRSTDFGDDKDRVLVKADGDYTYFAADIAYHKNKFDRGFDRVINIWGADHHGYVVRMKAACSALGHDGQLDVVIGQLVNLYRNGEAVRMSKRTGEMVTFEELLEEVGADAARYWFLRRSTDQQVDFDIELARTQSADNPVFYVQYAHARICSILRKAAGDEIAERHATIAALAAEFVRGDADLSLLTEEAELSLMRKLSEFAEIVEGAARDLAPHRLTHYAEDLAAAFHQFYTLCRVMTDDAELTAARLYAIDALRNTLETVLGLLGVSAPERM